MTDEKVIEKIAKILWRDDERKKVEKDLPTIDITDELKIDLQMPLAKRIYDCIKAERDREWKELLIDRLGLPTAAIIISKMEAL